MGRKSKYETCVKPFLEQIREWHKTKPESYIYETLGVKKASWENYKKQYSELREALKDEAVINARIEENKKMAEIAQDALMKLVTGYHETETDTMIKVVGGKETKEINKRDKYIPPNVQAILAVLKNCDPDYHMDDATTIEFKRMKLELEKMKFEKENW